MNHETMLSIRPERMKLGDILINKKIITEDQLNSAIEIQKKNNNKLGHIFVEMGVLSEEMLAETLAKQIGSIAVNLNRVNFSQPIVNLLPESLAKRYKAIPLEDKGSHVIIVVSDPFDLYAKDEIEKIIKKKTVYYIAPEKQIIHTIEKVYRKTGNISGFTKELENDLDQSFDLKQFSASADTESAPVAKLILSIFEDALHMDASDIHIEPMEAHLQVRLRINGELQAQMQADKRIAPAVTQRLKLMSGLDIAEKRLPQDGRFSVKLSNTMLDVRISTLPSQHGESTVMRLLKQDGAIRPLKEIGMPEKMLERYRTLLHRSSGMILVTGPTGSGKTTTLYSSLADLNANTLKIITAEDPIEYRLPGITQVQINEKIEFTFSKVLRSCLRQDPDAILVGEMRDAETAEIGLRASATGHMVLSTLHTNSASKTPMRLLDMGVPPFMVASSLNAVIAQRLIAVICQRCKAPHIPNQQEQIWIERMLGDQANHASWQKGIGCSQCNQTGIGGRQAVYEMLEITPELARLIAQGKVTEFDYCASESMKGKTYLHHALDLAKMGIVPIENTMQLSVESDND